MTNKEMLQIAMQQSAIDMSCNKEDYEKKENVVVISKNHPEGRKYLELPFYCNLASYGNNVVASVSSEIKEKVEAYINTYPIEHCFETPNLYVLNDALQEHDMSICFMAEYFLPDVNSLKKLDCEFTLKVLEQKDFNKLYTPEWNNALCESRKQLDVLGVGAYDGDKLIGLAGCSADCEMMWQIGVDVLPEYRRKGIATAITSSLAIEILDREKVPFYCAAWSNIKSVRNAIKSGFRPAWVEVTAKSNETVNKMNRKG
nr:GNAT family N-acetyltransferase [Anaeromicropila herbilytica]